MSKIMKTLTLTLILIILTSFMQHPEHTGIVVDSSGSPQAGCKVSSPELNICSYTDFDGRYTISVPDGTLITIEYISYETSYVISKDGIIVTLKDAFITIPEKESL